MKRIRVQFEHYWEGFDPLREFAFLAPHYELELSDEPQVVFFSVFYNGKRVHRTPKVRSNAVRVFHTSENVVPDMKRCDYAFGFHPEPLMNDDRYYRLPNYVLRLRRWGFLPTDLVKQDEDAQKTFEQKTKFCNFIYSNKNAEQRNRFFDLLSKYKTVDAPGPVRNNMPRLPRGVGIKLDFLQPYKFTIAFENESAAGYTTEKLVEPMLLRGVPIYWGDPEVGHDYNTKRFVSYHDGCHSLDDLVERVIELDRNDDAYIETLSQPFFHDNTPPPCFDMERLLNQFHRIFDGLGS